ncbi:unnamed protein product [Lepeophtheirus salmonis]|uniref:(salmon louse) hypothetical protein n=1 Tax=Lepeophtheirus salmonis TaxID=72036 RepID=A0A7R8H322_LEPSM|nr:unnamed protein product [Lepeophtheirus salmonis]CAF2839315.1 unnamed protein product [Lepeophtheirus salmonis]
MSEIVKLLDRRFRNALHYAARHADESKRNEIIAYLESYGLDRSTTDTFGNNADFYMQNDFPEIAPKEEGVEVKSSDESEDEPTLEPTNEIKITIEEYFDPLNVVKQAIKKQAKLTLKPQLTHLKGDEEEESQVRNAIKEKNFDILVKHILEGNSDKLMNKTSTDEEVQEFLDSVSIYQTKISKLHKAVENGSLKQLQIHLDRRKLHNEIVKYLTSYFPETLNVKDKLDRTPLHYAAAISDRDALSSDTSIYGMLINAGADNQIKDKKNNVPDIYVIKKSEFNETILKKYMRDPEPFLPTIEQPQHVTLEGSYNEKEDELTKWRYMKNITSEEDKQYYEGIFEEEGSDEEGITDFNVPEGNLDLETIAQLERSFRKNNLGKASSFSPQKFLIKPVFDKLKEKITISHGASLFDVIKGGIEILNHDLGVVAPDPESYKVFAPIIKPIIYTYHNIPILKNQLRSRTQPETQWKPSDKNFWKNVNDIKVQSCDSSILSYKISLHRSIKGYPLNSRMTSNQYITLENDMKAVLSNCSFFPSRTSSSIEVKNNKDEHIQFFIAAGGSNFWPLGRSTWVAPREGYNSIQIRINQIDHLEVIRCFSPSEELLDVILETRDILDEIELKLRDLEESMIYLRDTEYGYLTFSPGDLGTGLRLFGYMEVPNNVNFKILKATEVTDNFSLRINGKSPFILLISHQGFNQYQ